MKVIKYMIEGLRRFLQKVTGFGIFDLPIMNSLRNIIYIIIFDEFGKKNLFLNKILFYVPHGFKISTIKIGNKVKVSANVQIDCSAPVKIEDEVWISQNVQIFNHNHMVKTKELKSKQEIKKTSGICIKKDAWIGASVIILPNVSEIGQGAIIGAGSVVTKNVGDYEIVAGNPARKIGSREMVLSRK